MDKLSNGRRVFGICIIAIDILAVVALTILYLRSKGTIGVEFSIGVFVLIAIGFIIWRDIKSYSKSSKGQWVRRDESNNSSDQKSRNR